MKILIADDDDHFRRLLAEILEQWGYEVTATASGEEALVALQSDDSPRVAILDWMMSGLTGIEVCRKVRDEMAEPYTYLILLTSQQREEDLVLGMEAGADDYLTKPLKVNELRVRLRAGIRIIELQTELVEAREYLRHKASHDSLTGLWNHEEIRGILRRELAREERVGGCVSVIMADIDHFKRINDTYGHLVGDEVLRQVAHRMQVLARTYDFIGRYGGEEFMLVVPQCCRDCTVAFAERLRKSISRESFETSAGKLPVTLSLGVASLGAGVDAETLVREADHALYRAKERGRNRVEAGQ
ncbi:GGDEF domain-containing response regulator [Geomesophilobacter sediminis]|uniref:diguanylate cyclase n=1 Tax=Geomesophilobacter sediminis TaxID=2798584 RepID=A0A8J7JJ26_9BACT|nr:diguanylate cyclase [Geomesophilobacter sediminis]MBJ6724500.1 diguanylate cyclase [Geomesophilobacter sediminis]